MDLKPHPCLLHIHGVKLTSNPIDFCQCEFLVYFLFAQQSLADLNDEQYLSPKWACFYF